MNYQPRPGSIAAHVCAWFKANPGRKLTTAEICGRFGGTSAKLAAELGAAEDADYLLSEYLGRSNVYSAGPKLATWTPPADSMATAEPATAAPSPAASAPPPAPAAKRALRRVTLPPVEALVIEDSVPLPSLRTPANGSPYDAVFKAMKPGQSFSRPHDEARSLKASADRWAKRHAGGKPKFALRQENETHSRVWRKE